jgi:hypothetical protein
LSIASAASRTAIMSFRARWGVMKSGS